MCKDLTAHQCASLRICQMNKKEETNTFKPSSTQFLVTTTLGRVIYLAENSYYIIYLVVSPPLSLYFLFIVLRFFHPVI